MKRSVLAALCALTVALAAVPAGASGPATALAPLHQAHGETAAGEYLVVLERGRSAAAVARAVGVTPGHVYEHALDGFAATLTGAQLARVRANPDVAHVEPNHVATVANFVQHQAPWGLDRTDQTTLPLDGLYHWAGNAGNVNAYVFDTGIQTGHIEFTSRAGVFLDVFGGNGQDCHGHGTHVAGTIGAFTYGVAKTVKLWSVRVLNCTGSGTYAGIISAVDTVAAKHTAPAVAIMAFGGPYSAALNAAVTNLVQSGVFVTAAAGNSGSNACNYSPGSAAGVMTVGATNSSDVRPGWSNSGNCVDVWAPGAGITSTWIGGGINAINGTSMAAAHVTGVGALVHTIGGNPFTWITANATTAIDPNGPYPLLYKSNL
jgi:subtilisin family serine protease